MFRLVPDLAPAPRPAPERAAGGVRPGDVLVVEAATGELALQEVAAKLGDRVEILAAEKLRRGGVAGFFAVERCRLTVRVPGEAPAEEARAADEAAVLGAPGAGNLDDVLARMTAEVGAEEADFASVLRRRLHQDPPPPGAQARQAAQAAQAAQAGQIAQLKELLREPPLADGPLPGQAAGVEHAEAGVPLVARDDAPPARAPRLVWRRDGGAPAGTGPVRWSAGALERVGVPPALIDAVERQEPVDDAGWLVALAAAVAPSCRPLPSGDALVAGPRADALAAALDLVTLDEDGAAPESGTLAVALRDTPAGMARLRALLAGRWLHAVVGGTGWDGLLPEAPLAVSWVGDDWLPAALQQCVDGGAVLAYGGAGAGAPVYRANPVDVALAVRSLLPRR